LSKNALNAGGYTYFTINSDKGQSKPDDNNNPLEKYPELIIDAFAKTMRWVSR